MHAPLPAAAPPVFSVWRRALAVAFGAAGLALFSSFFALGALFGEVGFSLAQAAAFTVFAYALPGQLVAAELIGNGVGVVAVATAVWLVNARLLPMTVVLLPLLGERKSPLWADVALSHFIAVTSWVSFLVGYRAVPPAARRQYYVILGGALWLGGVVATALGHFVGAAMPASWLVVLLFLNPAYFLCVMLRSLRARGDVIAFACGMLLLPLAHQYAAEWDIVAAGLVGGGVAFWLERR